MRKSLATKHTIFRTSHCHRAHPTQHTVHNNKNEKIASGCVFMLSTVLVSVYGGFLIISHNIVLSYLFVNRLKRVTSNTEFMKSGVSTRSGTSMRSQSQSSGGRETKVVSNMGSVSSPGMVVVGDDLASRDVFDLLKLSMVFFFSIGVW